MKNLKINILFIVCFLLSNFIQGQDYEPIFDDAIFSNYGTSWEVQVHELSGNKYCFDFVTDSIQLFGGEYYYKVVGPGITRWLREDDSNRQVWYTNYLGGPEELLYDFSLEVGDDFSFYMLNGNEVDLVVTEVTMVSTLAGPRKQITLTGNLDFGGYMYWIEGIGARSDLFYFRLATDPSHRVNRKWTIGTEVYNENLPCSVPCPGASGPFYETDITDTSVKVHWSGSAYTAAQSFTVYYREVGTSDWTTQGSAYPSPLELTGLTPNTTYEWLVHNICTAIDYSNLSEFTTYVLSTKSEIKSKINLFTEDGQLVLQNDLGEALDVSIYGISGQLIDQFRIGRGATSIGGEVPITSLYFIVISKEGEKLLTKKVILNSN